MLCAEASAGKRRESDASRGRNPADDEMHDPGCGVTGSACNAGAFSSGLDSLRLSWAFGGVTIRLCGMSVRRPYLSDMSDEEGTLIAPSDALAGGGRTLGVSVARGVQRPVQRGEDWCALDGSLSASAALADDGLLRGAGRGPSHGAAPGSGTTGSGQCCHRGHPDLALHAGKRRTGRVRRREAEEGLQAVSGGRPRWATRFRRLAKDYDRYASTLADLHLVAFTAILLKQAAQLAADP